MKNPDREELFTPDELAVRLDEWANCLDKSQWDLRSDMRCAAIHLRRLASSDGGVREGRVSVPEGQTPLNDDLGHRYLDVIKGGQTARDTGVGSPYHGHSLEHVLHAVGWVQRDLSLALDKTKAARPSAPPADAGMREAYRAGWYVNAVEAGDGEDQQPASYLANCEQVDWEEYVKALTAPGATTKSDGGEQPPRVGLDWKLSDDAKQRLAEINAAIVRPGDPRLATVIGGGTDFCGHHVMKSLCPTCSPSPSDPSSTRSEVTVEDEPPENMTIGGVTWHSSEEDSGPDVGISVYVGPNDRLWCGEISRRLFDEHDGHANFDNDGGAFIVRYGPQETTLIAKCADMDTGREFIEQIAEWVRKAALLDQFEIRRK